MRVLVLGSGGREHALAWKIAQSPELTQLLCAPGNPGTAGLAENVSVNAEDPAAVVALARSRRVDLVVVGPEAPLVKGVADELRRAGIAVFGPDARAANIEGSKAFAKEIMTAAGVPTAAFRTFEGDPAGAEAYARQQGRIVVKADGLAAGKGVVVARSAGEAVAAVRELSRTGAGARLVLEELLEGEEISMIALCDGERFVLLPPARDHKRVGDGDTGPNTGGMGAFAPVKGLLPGLVEEVGRTVIAPTLAELARRGMPFRGALYAGLMLTAQGPRVLEFNARFGDPETQVLMLAVEDDLLPVLDACARGTLAQTPLTVAPGVAVGVVVASEGYPAAPKTGDRIDGLESLPADVVVFHAGTRRQGTQLLTSGGRVLTVCARRDTADEARRACYEAIGRLRIRGMHFRRDIGASARG
ncbi:MAG: phosphoribosylamine--glycine ligase [Myxococcaceae bacterium]|nr:phosphoribosylamine--glycine ligase [Myxococcaceae bacterium]